MALHEPGRTAFQVYSVEQVPESGSSALAWMELGSGERVMWAKVEAAVLLDLREAARQAVQAHAAISMAMKAEAADEAIEAEKHMEAALQRLRVLVEGESEWNIT
ncbi:hypothetical protein [Methylorubrum extorquens]|uniref:Uncharacterized protein n=1 Tax=Methylorubrum extorquens TaxID=408 RepID=A0AAX3WKS0_METEX|nr:MULTISPECIES: hypothetical protein [Methylobacteriaceae]WHQ71389.1 hypothetical protein KEC54_07495 [Methylorubrum extorquens]